MYEGCRKCSDDVSNWQPQKKGLWTHVWACHKSVLQQIFKKYELVEDGKYADEVAFALYNAALVHSERQSCPRVGVSTDRRCMQHLSEVFQEDQVKTLICFICGCKHVFCEGFSMMGDRKSKGTIRYRTDQKKVVSLIFGEQEDDQFLWIHNLSSKRFKTHFI